MAPSVLSDVCPSSLSARLATAMSAHSCTSALSADSILTSCFEAPACTMCARWSSLMARSASDRTAWYCVSKSDEEAHFMSSEMLFISSLLGPPDGPVRLRGRC